MLLYLAADLLWATKIKGVADALGIHSRPVRTMEMLEARLADTPARALVVDLEKPAEALAMIRRLRGEAATPAQRAIRIAAWGPHVEATLLLEAKEAGADEVLTRGAFDRTMPDVLRRLTGA